MHVRTVNGIKDDLLNRYTKFNDCTFAVYVSERAKYAEIPCRKTWRRLRRNGEGYQNKPKAGDCSPVGETDSIVEATKSTVTSATGK